MRKRDVSPTILFRYRHDRMMLTLSEVLQLKLHSEMVVLSACNTGSRKVTRSEGVTSMGTAPRPCCGYDTAHRLQRPHRFFAISQFDSVSVTASLKRQQLHYIFMPFLYGI